MPMPGTKSENDTGTPPLKGSPANPGRDPRKLPPIGKGSIGDVAFCDAVAMVIGAWILLILLYTSLRGHNI